MKYEPLWKCEHYCDDGYILLYGKLALCKMCFNSIRRQVQKINDFVDKVGKSEAEQFRKILCMR
jgi:hypothetical protein